MCGPAATSGSKVTGPPLKGAVDSAGHADSVDVLEHLADRQTCSRGGEKSRGARWVIGQLAGHDRPLRVGVRAVAMGAGQTTGAAGQYQRPDDSARDAAGH